MINTDQLRFIKSGSGLDFYEYKPRFGKWYYKEWIGFREDKKKHTKSHWLRMCLEFLEGGYKIYYAAQNDALVFYVLVAPGGRRLKGTSRSDYVFGPYYTAECYRGQGVATKALTEVLSWDDFNNTNVYSYIQKTNIASLKVVEKCGAKIVGQAIMKGFLRRLYHAENGMFYVVKYERN